MAVKKEDLWLLWYKVCKTPGSYDSRDIHIVAKLLILFLVTVH